MKDINTIRRILANIFYLRNAAVVAVDERDENTLRNKLKDMRREIDTLETILNEGH